MWLWCVIRPQKASSWDSTTCNLPGGEELPLQERLPAAQKEQPTPRPGVWEREHLLLLRWSRKSTWVLHSRDLLLPWGQHSRTTRTAVLERQDHSAAQGWDWSPSWAGKCQVTSNSSLLGSRDAGTWGKTESCRREQQKTTLTACSLKGMRFSTDDIGHKCKGRDID